MTVYLYDDSVARAFEPFALTRPAGELRAGAVLTRERWARVAGTDVAGHVTAEHLHDFDEAGAPSVITDAVPAGSMLVNARALPALDAAAPADAPIWRVDGRLAGVRLPRAVAIAEMLGGTQSIDGLARSLAVEGAVDLPGRWLGAIWDLIGQLPAQLTEDVSALGPGLALETRLEHVGRRGEHALYVERGAELESFVFVDLTAGPVLVRAGAVVQAFTRLVGPCVIGAGSTVSTDRIATVSIGDACRVHGELSTSILIGHANKSHDGFVGHSVLGRWVNLGAGTITSNLKNTYGSVQLWTPSGQTTTGLMFLGTMFGDFAKTGIGTRLTTGTVIGAGANIYGGDTPTKFVPPFAWGSHAPYDSFALDKFLQVAERQMARRSVTLDDAARRQLRAAHRRAGQRRDNWRID